MKIVDQPKVYLVGKTDIVSEGMEEYLADIGGPDWFVEPRVSGGENLIEAAGRMCYRSWQPWDPNKPECSNPNVTKVREGNNKYMANIIKSGHGAVLEHVNLTFIIRDCSRVFTHELVRHRAGMAYSQESLRYVRLSDIRFWLPELVKEKPKAVDFFKEVLPTLENIQATLFGIFQIDRIKDFSTKKMLTSMFRRLAPIGLATSIMVTGNLRAWRHIIKMRTETVAEEEIRLIIGQVAQICKDTYPHVFYDMHKNEAEEWVFEYEKV
jgi:thymidylate synthase (FAD)